MQLSKITIEQAKNISGADYNQNEWNKRIDSIASQKGCQFYLEPATGSMGYERLWATYTMPEGITILNTFSPYSSCLSNNGFCMVRIVRMNNTDENLFETHKHLAKDRSGKEGYIANDKANRLIMAKNSQNAGVIYCSNI